MASVTNGYRIVEAKTTEALAQAVTLLFATGWEPIGGVSAVANRPTIGAINCTFYQAMIRRPPEPPPIPRN
jgi:hypothetical protein